MLSVREGRRAVLRRLWTTTPSPEQIQVVALAADTAAQVVHFLGEYVVQVSDQIPRRLHETVAHHVVTRHLRGHECITRNCRLARAWLVVCRSASA